MIKRMKKEKKGKREKEKKENQQQQQPTIGRGTTSQQANVQWRGGMNRGTGTGSRMGVRLYRADQGRVDSQAGDTMPVGASRFVFPLVNIGIFYPEVYTEVPGHPPRSILSI
jgi:hypothetical protein